MDAVYIIIGLILGFILLVKGAYMLVENSAKLAKNWGFSPYIISMTFVAFGTSLPELAISITSALEGLPSLAIGTVLGSNIFSLGFIIGACAFITPLAISKSTLKKEIYFVFASLLILFLLSFDTMPGRSSSGLQWIDGLILLITFGAFIWYAVKYALFEKNIQDVKKKILSSGEKSTSNFIMLLLGIGGVVIGSWLVVQQASSLALKAGMDPLLVGLSAVAIGVSLPELFTAMMASLKNQEGVTIGLIIGSSVFNILWVLGITALIGIIPVTTFLFYQIAVVALFSLFLYFFMTTQRTLSSFEGLIMVGVYIVYLISIF